MSRTIPSQYLAGLASDGLTLAIAVKISRTDGLVQAFTTTDVSLLDYEGFTPGLAPPGYPIVYLPVNSVSSTSLKATSDTGVDNLEVYGILDSDHIAEDDLRKGLYDNAKVWMYLLDPRTNPVNTKIEILRGQVGTITLDDGKYTWEIRSTSQFFKQQFGNVTTPTCRARFGDNQCAPGGFFKNGNTITDYTFGATAALVHDGFSFEATPATSWPSPDITNDYFAEGIITFTSGPNSGVSREVKFHTDTGVSGHRIFNLRRPFPFEVTTGDTFNAIAGCQWRFRTDCIGKFANSDNFHGEPEIPGNDTLIQIGRS